MFARSRENRIPFLLTSRPYDEISFTFLPQTGGILLETRRSSSPQVFLIVTVPKILLVVVFEAYRTLAWIITKKDSVTDIFPIQFWLHLNSRH